MNEVFSCKKWSGLLIMGFIGEATFGEAIAIILKKAALEGESISLKNPNHPILFQTLENTKEIEIPGKMDGEDVTLFVSVGINGNRAMISLVIG